MLARDSINDDGLGELVARLAVAVMIADGHITDAELHATDRFDALELPSLSMWLRTEIERARQAPIDVARTAAALAEIAPGASAIIMSTLAEIAVSDRDLSPRELEVLGVIASEMRLTEADLTHALRVAAARTGPIQGNASPRPAAEAAPAAPVTRESNGQSDVPRVARPVAPSGANQRGTASNLSWALSLLGLSGTASMAEADATYAALVRRYNPVAVMELGPEFAVLAVQRLNAITTAYLAVRQSLSGQPVPPATHSRIGA